MRFLITGATGFLGSRLVSLLLERDYNVNVLVRSKSKLKVLDTFNKNLKIFFGDITDISSIESAIRNVDFVLHCSSVVSFYRKNNNLMHLVNVVGTENILKLSLKSGIKRFVYISSVNALGFPSVNTIGNENTEFNWNKYKIGYMNTKYQAEQKVFEYIKKGLDAVIVNPGTIFGAGDVNFNSGKYIVSIYKSKIMGYIKGGFTQCIVDNVAEGCLLALKKGRKGERYILGGFNLSYKEFFKLVSQSLNLKRIFIYIPYPFFIFLGYIIYFFSILFRKAPIITPELIKASPLYLFYSSEKAIKELGYNPGNIKDLKKSIKEQLLWYKKNNLIK